MKIKILLSFAMVACGFCFSSSMPEKNVSTPEAAYSALKIYLVETIIGDIIPADLPALDAPEFNHRAKTIGKEILELELKQIENYRKIYADSIKKYLNCNVVYGEELVKKTAYQELVRRLNFQENLKFEGSILKKIVIPPDESNLLNFSDGNITRFLNDYSTYNNPMADICKTLDADLIAFSNTQLHFTYFGRVCLESTLYFFNKEGSLVAKGNGSSRITTISGYNLSDYTVQLGTLELIIGDIMHDVVKKLGKKRYIN